MLVDRHTTQPNMLEDFAGKAHGRRQVVELTQGKPAQKRRHEPRGKLGLGNRLTRGAADQVVDLLGRQLAAIAFFADKFDEIHEAYWGSSRKLKGSSSRKGLVSVPWSAGKQITASGETNSLSTCRQAPQGGLGAWLRFATAIATIL